MTEQQQRETTTAADWRDYPAREAENGQLDIGPFYGVMHRHEAELMQDMAVALFGGPDPVIWPIGHTFGNDDIYIIEIGYGLGIANRTMRDILGPSKRINVIELNAEIAERARRADPFNNVRVGDYRQIKLPDDKRATFVFFDAFRFDGELCNSRSWLKHAGRFLHPNGWTVYPCSDDKDAVKHALQVFSSCTPRTAGGLKYMLCYGVK